MLVVFPGQRRIQLDVPVRDLGRGFIESALDAYYRRAITGSDLSEYLEIKLNGLPKLEAELAATGGARD